MIGNCGSLGINSQTTTHERAFGGDTVVSGLTLVECSQLSVTSDKCSDELVAISVELDGLSFKPSILSLWTTTLPVYGEANGIDSIESDSCVQL